MLEKIKELRQKFTNAVTQGTRSGSGKLMLEYYELSSIWGGLASTTPLPFGRESSGSLTFDNNSETAIDSDIPRDVREMFVQGFL